MGIQSRQRIFIKDGLATLFMLPALWVILDLIGQLVRDVASLVIVAEVVVPVIVAGGVVGYFTGKRKTILGVELGILVTFVGYVLVLLWESQATVECRRQHPDSYLCGEAVGLLAFRLIEIFLINAIALVGVGHWFHRLRKRD